VAVEVFQEKLASLKGTPSDEANFKNRLSKHASIILVSENVIKKYQLVIKEMGGHISILEGHKRDTNSAFEAAKKEFDSNISAFILEMTKYKEAL